MAAANPSSSDVRSPRILIVRVGAMGDILHGLPAVAALRTRLPDAYLGWAVEPRWRALLVGDGSSPDLINHLHPVATRDWKRSPFATATLRQIAALRRNMRLQRYDVCVDLQGSIRSAAIGRMAGADRLLGPEQPRERQARVLYGERIHVQARHVIDQACELLSAAVAGPLPLLPAPVTLPADREAERWAENLLAGSGRPFVLLAPTAGWGAKEWPAERYRALAARLTEAGLRVLVNASSADDSAARTIAAEIVPCTLPQLIALTRRAALVVGGDTGPVHLAAALGRPVVALFGPTDPARNGPAFVGADTLVLRHQTSILSHRRLTETEPGLARITVEDVFNAAETQLRQPKEAAFG